MKILVLCNESSSLSLLKYSIEKKLPDSEILAVKEVPEQVLMSEGFIFDIAFLDINKTGGKGLEIAEIIKAKNPRVNIIFVADHEGYGMCAMKMHASGYILKPVTPEQIEYELQNLRYPLPAKCMLKVICFGRFDAYTPKGELLVFKRSKAKELLAFLVSKKGIPCTLDEMTCLLFGTLGEKGVKKQYTHKVKSALISKLKEIGAEDIINSTYNSVSINMDKIDCDYYKLDENDRVNFKGEFMSQYPWAQHIKK